MESYIIENSMVNIYKGPYKGYKGEFIEFISHFNLKEINKEQKNNVRYEYKQERKEIWYHLRIYMMGHNQDINIDPSYTSVPDPEQMRKHVNNVNKVLSKNNNIFLSDKSNKSNESYSSSDAMIIDDEQIEGLKRKRSSSNNEPRKNVAFNEIDNFFAGKGKISSPLSKIMEELFNICNFSLSDPTSISLHVEQLMVLLSDSRISDKTDFSISDGKNYKNIYYRLYAIAYLYIYLNEIGKQIDVPGSRIKVAPNWDHTYIFDVCVEKKMVTDIRESEFVRCIDDLLEVKKYKIKIGIIKENKKSPRILGQGRNMIKTMMFNRRLYVNMPAWVPKNKKSEKLESFIVQPIITTPVKSLMITKLKNRMETLKTDDANRQTETLLKKYEEIINGKNKKILTSKELEILEPYIKEYYKMVEYYTKYPNKIKPTTTKATTKTIPEKRALTKIEKLLETNIRKGLDVVDNSSIDYITEQIKIVKDSKDKKYYEDLLRNKIMIDFLVVIDNDSRRTAYINKNKQYADELKSIYNTYNKELRTEIKKYQENPNITVKTSYFRIQQETDKETLIQLKIDYLKSSLKNVVKESDIEVLKYIISNYRKIISLPRKEIEKMLIENITETKFKRERNRAISEEYYLFQKELLSVQAKRDRELKNIIFEEKKKEMRNENTPIYYGSVEERVNQKIERLKELENKEKTNSEKRKIFNKRNDMRIREKEKQKELVDKIGNIILEDRR
jgi:hypothetical protein